MPNAERLTQNAEGKKAECLMPGFKAFSIARSAFSFYD